MTQVEFYDTAMQLLTNRYCFEQALSLLNVKLGKKKKKKKRKPELPATPTQNLVRRRGSRICRMQARLYGRKGHIFRVLYPSGFQGALQPRLKSMVLTHPWTKLDMYYSTNMRLRDDKYDLVCRPSQRLVVYLTQSNHVIGLIMPKYY